MPRATYATRSASPGQQCEHDQKNNDRSRVKMFDFDRVIDRRGTHASKWDSMAKLSGIDAPDAIPMWVADMDFAAPPDVTEALMAMARRGVYGYYADNGSWAAALAEWMQRRHNLTLDPAW